MSARDSWRLAVGTLTVIPVRPPTVVDRRVACGAMLLAPLAAVPLGLAVMGLGALAQWLDLPALVTAVLMVGSLALGCRNFHYDGLSDTVDGLAASYDRERSLEVMKSGVAGPAGVVALIVVIGLQVAALAHLVGIAGGPVLAGVAVVASRAALPVCCARGIPSARPDGLGGMFAGSVPRGAAAAVWVVAVLVLTAAGMSAQLPVWYGLVTAAVALVVLAALLRRACRRLGGVTGDVFGAAVELTFAALVVTLACA